MRQFRIKLATISTRRCHQCLPHIDESPRRTLMETVHTQLDPQPTVEKSLLEHFSSVKASVEKSHAPGGNE